MKRIKSESDLDLWHQSSACSKLQTFLEKLFTSVKGLKLSEIPEIPHAPLLNLLQKVKDAVKEVEPTEMTGQRYGNKSFRVLIQKIKEIAENELKSEFLQKLFVSSFGDSTRIDYGTGHELSFIIFVMCHCEIEIDCGNKNNFAAWIGCRLIGKEYLELVRWIQERYSLEPAGSHGVWGLDDHQFIPFLLGSAQLIGKEGEDGGILAPASIIQPRSFSSEQIRSEYLYPAALYHIQQVKTRSNPSLQFHHHSPLLYDISGVPTWQRIHDGLKKMYLKEVLSKFPVVQHLLFDDELFKFE